MLSDPRTPRSNDIQNVYGVGYIQETDQSIEFYDKNSCVLLGCFYIAVIVMLGYCIAFGVYAYTIYGGSQRTVDATIVNIVELRRSPIEPNTIVGYKVYLAYEVDERIYDRTIHIDVAEADDWQFDGTVTLFYNTKSPRKTYFERRYFRAIDVDRVQHFLRRIAFLFVVNTFLWYIMFSHRYRTPLEWLRHPFRRT